MTNHITESEWRSYFTRGPMTAQRLKLFSRVHAHIGSCAECRALHLRLSESDNALLSLISAQADTGSSAYLAVAGDSPAPADGESVLSVEIENGVFLYGTLSLSGDFLRYEFLPESDAPCLTDACDPSIRMEIADGHLSLHFRPFPGAELRASLSVDGVIHPLGDPASADIPLPSTRCRIYITAGSAR